MEKHKVICPYCGAGCQFNLLVQNGQVVGTEPLNGITNQGELCLKGMSGYDFINDTKILTPRVLHPMIRRTKGADLERVSWDEALDFTASKMQAITQLLQPMQLSSLTPIRWFFGSKNKAPVGQAFAHGASSQW